jgi:hypothetical protein
MGAVAQQPRHPFKYEANSWIQERVIDRSGDLT